MDRVFLVVVEDDNLSLLGSQEIKGIIQHFRCRKTPFFAGDIFSAAEGTVFTGGDPIGFTPWSILLQAVDQQSSTDCEQPGAETISLVESFDISKHAHKRILDDVLSEFRFATNSEEKPIKASLMGLDQFGERSDIS